MPLLLSRVGYFEVKSVFGKYAVESMATDLAWKMREGGGGETEEHPANVHSRNTLQSRAAETICLTSASCRLPVSGLLLAIGLLHLAVLGNLGHAHH